VGGVLVTGGAGFVGNNFVRLLLAETDERVTVLDALTYAGDRRNLAGLPADRFDFVHGSVCDPDVVDDLVAAHEVVVHFAAETHNDNSLAEPGRFVTTNLVGTQVVLEAVRRHGRRLHHVSTDEVYGELAPAGGRPFTEADPYRPSSPYSATKAGADLLVRAWVRSFGVAATISISPNNYGPRQHVEKFIPRQVTEVLQGRRPRLYGDGSQVRDWLHVDDHSRAVLTILQAGTIGETYHVGAGCERTNREVVDLVLALLGRPPGEVDLVADRPGHDRRYALDASRLRTELGWAPGRADFAAGLAETVAWYGDNPEWWRPAKAATEARYAALGR
jgi:dTDP-glucose 4,6-dehydratase